MRIPLRENNRGFVKGFTSEQRKTVIYGRKNHRGKQSSGNINLKYVNVLILLSNKDLYNHHIDDLTWLFIITSSCLYHTLGLYLTYFSLCIMFWQHLVAMNLFVSRMSKVHPFVVEKCLFLIYILARSGSNLRV